MNESGCDDTRQTLGGTEQPGSWHRYHPPPLSLVQGPSSRQPSRVAGDDSSDLGGSSAKDFTPYHVFVDPVSACIRTVGVICGGAVLRIASFRVLALSRDRASRSGRFSSRSLTHSVNGSPPPVLLINHNQRSLSTSRISQQTCSVCLLATTPAARDELA